MTATRIAACFAACRAERRAAFIAYILASDPHPARTPTLMHALVAGGVDLIELGYPSPDPVLDGPALQAAHARSVAAGGSIDTTLAALTIFRAHDTRTPVVAMGYADQLADYGHARFAADLAAAGGDGAIVADLRLRDAAQTLLPQLASNGLVLIPLASPARRPSTPIETTQGLGGFFYAIPLDGPTGSAPAGGDAVRAAVVNARTLTSLPVAIGFGVRTPETAAEVARVADAVAVGSAIAARIASGASADELTAFARSFRRAIDAVAAPSPPAPAPAAAQ